MKPEEQRIAIAEACGWRWLTRKGDKSSWLFSPTEVQKSDRMGTVSGFEFIPEIEDSYRWGAGSNGFPDYLSDLNAMHEAENQLTEVEFQKYECKLRIVVGDAMLADYSPIYIIRATAAQRAEAFLRTLNLWK